MYLNNRFIVLIQCSVLVVACGGADFTSTESKSSSSSGGTNSGTGSQSGGGKASRGGGAGAAASGAATGASDAGSMAGAGGLSGAGGTGAGGAIGSGGLTTTGGAAGAGETAGAGGSAGAGATTGTGGATTDTCPSSQPTTGASCNSNALNCNYGQCCPSTATCTNGAWQLTAAPCRAPACPSSKPVNGTTCTCMDGLSCNYDRCSNGGSNAQARCTSGVWSVVDLGCSSFSCGMKKCNAGDICVQTSGLQGTSYDCVTSVCHNPGAACTCIGSACQDQGGVCTSTGDGAALCTVP